MASMGIQPADLPNWMSKLQNDDYVSMLSIPGTHDSAAFTRTLTPFVQTQTLNFTQQLDAGIRFFDLRINFVSYLRPNNLLLMLVHGPINLGTILRDVLLEMYNWLDGHPQEALFVQIKQDGNLPARKTMADLSRNFFDLIDKAPEYWRRETNIPKMSELRYTSGSKTHGKIQLIRRFDRANQVTEDVAGLDVTNWKDNTDRHLIVASPPDPNPSVIIQDHYNWPFAEGDLDIVYAKRFDVVKALMNEATSSSPSSDIWFFNYVSAVRVGLTSSITPFAFAHGTYDVDGDDPTFIKGQNLRVYTELKSATTPKRYGVLLFDYPTDNEAPNLILQIVQNNTFRP